MFDLRRSRWKRLARLLTTEQNVKSRTVNIIWFFRLFFLFIRSKWLVPRALISFVFTVETRHRSKMFLAPFEGLERRIKGKLSPFATSPSGILRLAFRRRTLRNYSRISVMERRSRRRSREQQRFEDHRRWVTSSRLSQNRESSRIPETNNVTQESLLKRPVMCPKERIATDKASSSRKSETFEKTTSFGSSLVLYTSYKDLYLDTLQQRHLQEKELADRLMRQALNSWSRLLRIRKAA